MLKIFRVDFSGFVIFSPRSRYAAWRFLLYDNRMNPKTLRGIKLWWRREYRNGV